MNQDDFSESQSCLRDKQSTLESRFGGRDTPSSVPLCPGSSNNNGSAMKPIEFNPGEGSQSLASTPPSKVAAPKRRSGVPDTLLNRNLSSTFGTKGDQEERSATSPATMLQASLHQNLLGRLHPTFCWTEALHSHLMMQLVACQNRLEKKRRPPSAFAGQRAMFLPQQQRQQSRNLRLKQMKSLEQQASAVDQTTTLATSLVK